MIWSPTINPNELYLKHHGIQGQKWGKRNGPPYPLSENASKIYNRAKKKSTIISSDVSNAISKTSAKSYGLEHMLKTPDSIERKLKLGKDIKDAVRFTTISSEEDFVKNYISFKKDLQKKGYTETTCKNYFEKYKSGKVKHKSVQSNFKDKTGYIFEVQFQTKLSQDAKDKKVPIYNEARNPKTSAKRKAELEKQMVALAENVKDPIDIHKIKSHK